VATASRNVYIAMARKAAEKYGIDPDIFVRQIDQESGFADDVITGQRKSSAGAVGIAQFMPATARSMGVDPLNPEDALDGAARYMRQGLDRYGGDYRKALAAYNAGFGNVDKYGGVPPFEETQTYVNKILGGRSSGGSYGGQQQAPKKSLLERFNEYRANNKAKGNRPSTAEIKELGDSGQLPLVGAAGARNSGLAIQAGGVGSTGIRGLLQSGQRAVSKIDPPGALVPVAGTLKRAAGGGAGMVERTGGASANRARELSAAAAEQAARAERVAGRLIENPALRNVGAAIGMNGPNPAGLLGAGAAAATKAAGRLPNPLNLRNMFIGGSAVVGGAEALRNYFNSGQEDSPVAGNSTYDVDSGDSWGGPGSIGGPVEAQLIALRRLIAQRYGISEEEAQEVMDNAESLTEIRNFLEQDPIDKQIGDRALDRSEGARQFDLGFGENARQFDLGFGENQRQFDLGFAENKRQFDAQWQLENGRLGLDSAKYQTDLANWQKAFTENARQFDTQEGRLTELGRGQLGLATELGRGQLGLGQRAQGLEENKYITDVLRNPSDFISRAFLSRGQASPQATVTQADLINNLRAGIQQYATGGFTQEGKFITGDSKSGKPTGNEEMIVNPTNAPIMIIPNDQLDEGMGQLPRYAMGTIDMSQQAISGYGSKNADGSDFIPNQWNGDPNTWGKGDVPRMGESLTPMFNLEDWFNGTGPGSTGGSTGGNFRRNLGRLKSISQQELINMGKANLAPGAAAALYGGRIPNARPVGQLTPGKLSRLTPGELDALNSQLGVEFDTDLETEMSLLSQRFGPVVNRARGRLMV
jgi:hypothetical protein